MDHINCRCNVGHTKESNVETFRILKSEPILTIHKVSCFPLFHQYRIYPDYIIRKPWCVPDYIIRTAFVSSGRWSAPQRKRFGRCIAFLTTINGFSTLLSYKYHPSPPPFLTQTSPNLSSSSFYNDVFPSLVFHRKRPLWKSIRGYMISQQGRGQSAYEVGLSGRKFDHHGLLVPKGPCAPSVSPPIVKLLVCPISRSHWYNLPPPPRNSFRFLCNKLNKLQHL